MVTPALHGRNHELELGRGLIDDATHGRGSALVFEGEAGIGKTRLLEELVSWGTHRGARVLFGAAHELERDRPFGLLLDALGDLAADRPVLAELDEPTSAHRAIDTAIDLIEELSLNGPVVIALEDLHWADTPTIVAAYRLVRRVAPIGVCVMGTARPTPRSAELARLLYAIGAGGGHRVELGPLPDEDVSALLADLLGAEPGPHLARAAAGAAGNPLFVTELAQALDLDGAVRIHDGRAEVDEPFTPPSLRLVVARVLSDLSDQTLEIVRIASILGTSFSVADLASVVGGSASAIVALLEEARSARVLDDAGDRLAFRHDLVRDAVYHDLPKSVRAALHIEVGRAQAALGRPAALIATHFAIGAEQGDAEAISWLRRAAEETLHADPAVAVSFWQRCLDLMEDDHAERDEVGADLADALIISKGGAAAEPVAREFLAMALSSALEWRLRRALWRSLFEQGRLVEALEQLDALAVRADLTDAERAVLAALRGASRTAMDLDGAVREAEEAVRLGELTGEHYAVTVGSQTLCGAAYIRGDLEESIRLGERGDLSSHEIRMPHLNRRSAGHAVPLIELMYPLAELDRVEEARAVLGSVRRWSERVGLANVLLASHQLTGYVHWATGAWDDAIAELEAGLDLADELANAWGRDGACAILARIAGHREDTARVQRAGELLDLDAREGQISGVGAYVTMWVRSFLAECKGDLDEADRLISGAWQVVAGFGAVAHYRLIGPDYVRVKLAVDGGDDARAAAELVAESARRAGDVPTANGAALRCRGLVEGDADVLLRSVEEYRKGPRPVELAFACEDAGVALERAGRGAEASSLLDEAMREFESVGAVRDCRRVESHLRALGIGRGARGRRVRPQMGWEALTPAELTVLTLVCQGLANGQIAERLFLSRRTVEAHMSSIYRKLGASARTELVVRFAARAT